MVSWWWTAPGRPRRPYRPGTTGAWPGRCGRQNFLVPPRRDRAFPLVELAW